MGENVYEKLYMVAFKTSFKIINDFFYNIMNCIPFIISILLLTLAYVLIKKEEQKKGLIVIALSFAVPLLFSVNGVLVSGFPPFRYMLISQVLSAVVVIISFDILPKKLKFIEPFSLSFSNLFLAIPLYLMKPAKSEIFIFCLFLFIVPSLLFLKKIIKNNRLAVQLLLSLFTASLSLALSTNLSFSSIGTILFVTGTFVCYCANIIFFHYLLLKNTFDKDEFSEKTLKRNKLRFVLFSFLLLVSQNLISLGINL